MGWCLRYIGTEGAVHFVRNEGGNQSVVRNLTIEECRAGKEAYLKGNAPVHIEVASSTILA